MSEQHPLDPPPSNLVGVQNTYTTEQWQADSEHIKMNLLAKLYERLAIQKRIPVGIVEAGWFTHKDGKNVTVRMRVPTAPLLMDFAEHMEES